MCFPGPARFIEHLQPGFIDVDDVALIEWPLHHHHSPLLGPIGEDHLTLGVGYQIDNQWRVDGGVEFQLENNATYTNRDLPFGPDARLENKLTLLHVQAS